MPSLDGHGSGKLYWRSLDELADAPEFRAKIEHEFPYLADELRSPSSRRTFLKLMGASLALGGLTGCRWPKESIVEYSRRPAGRTPGVPVSYASTYTCNGVSTGVLVTSYDGRPIKIEGNPLHPLSLGASDSQMQAAILELYDPDRSVAPRIGKPEPSAAPVDVAKLWSEVGKRLADAAGAIKSSKGAGLAILSPPVGSPTLEALRAKLMAAAPSASWVEYSPVPLENEPIGTALALGSPCRAQLDFSKAEVVASFDCDFQLSHPAALRYTRDYARHRTAEGGKMSRLYVVECNLSLTGSNADHRYAERFSSVGQRLAQLAAALAKEGVEFPAGAKAKLASFAETPAYLASMAKDLAAHKGEGLVCVGARQPAAAHAVATMINAALGNAGKTVSYAKLAAAPIDGVKAMADLVQKMAAGSIDTLVILGGNPVYDAPADLAFAQALSKVRNSIRLGLYEDETSRECAVHIPAAHWLEAWGDGRAWDGTASIQQPLIAPLYDGKSEIEIVGSLLGEADGGYELVRTTWKSRLGGDFEAAWRGVLHDGVIAKSAPPAEAPAITATDWAGPIDSLTAVSVQAGAFEVIFEADRKMFDGRFVNSGWLQELPDPITKMTWDNAAYIAPADAAKLGLRRDDRIEISISGGSLKIPVCPVPGHARGAITLPLGWGRRHAGVVAKGCGFDVGILRTQAGFHSAIGAAKTVGDRYALATTQDHHAMESDVGSKEMAHRIPVLAREGTLAAFVHDRKFVNKIEGVHTIPLVQLFGYHDFPDQPRWAMAIDLSKCTGCSACVVACQSENNIPVVGKEEVQLGREMHWLRIDRYFQGDPQSDDIAVLHQPVPCQHCENAPCEQVCPVAATTHDEQGLNVMIYNRCIGTRYCSNNCPYKVRRFNWFNNQHGPRHPRSKAGGVTVFQTFDIKNSPSMLPQKKLTDIEKMGKNPSVTVRSRGVMEKCTFCVQRLTQAKIDARTNQVNPILANAGDGRPADNVVTACAQACPAEAITFGDLQLKGARIAGAFDHDRSYALLEEVNARPRVRYLAKLRNPAGEKAAAEPKAEHA
ncbi:MAG: TAT-variant-translocated molybdopterin oxidoreductase [Planctomycetes bacterium]|nr:TAT-variant-translocated molybdopterin oxidoreductase [Planctomycetota bacterium]